MRLLTKAFSVISLRSEPAVKWTPISAALEPVAGKAVLVGVVDEHAFLAAAHDVALDARLVGVVEQQPVVAIAVGNVVMHGQPVRVHQYVADAIAGRNKLPATSLSLVYIKCTAKRRSWKLLPRTTLRLLETEKRRRGRS